MDQQRLKELVHYCPETGVFTNRIRRANSPVGREIGTPHSSGYIYATIDKYPRPLHRMAMLYMLGWMPEQVDHINHDRADNRWVNLRAATQITNGRNMSMRSSNKSGVCGVCWDKSQNRWVSGIKVSGKKHNVYHGKDFFEAVCARKSAELRYGFHPNHGASVTTNETLPV